MTGSLLSWDDYEEDPNPAVAKAAKAVKNIDTAEVEIELEKMAVKQPTINKIQLPTKDAPNQSIGHSQAYLKAKEAISDMDSDLPHGGRLHAEDKKLLNSATDLNQLVPFKYDWAWMGYLESCNAHWMPTEISLEKDVIAIKESMSLNDRKLICDLLVNHHYLRKAVPNIAWLNLYRMIENPECRQYLLRQVFEETLQDHAMVHIDELTSIMEMQVSGKTILQHLTILKETYEARNAKLLEFLPMLIGTDGKTTTLDDIREFIVELIVIYGFVNYVSLIRPLYHILKLNSQRTDIAGLATIADLMLRDIVHHNQLFKMILSTALEENPGVVNQDVLTKQTIRLKSLNEFEADFNSLLAVDGEDYKDLTWFNRKLINDVFTMVGVHDSANDPMPSPFMDWFMGNLKNHEMKIHGGATTVTGQSGGALSW